MTDLTLPRPKSHTRDKSILIRFFNKTHHMTDLIFPRPKSPLPTLVDIPTFADIALQLFYQTLLKIHSSFL